jgi:hypothetical protein
LEQLSTVYQDQRLELIPPGLTKNNPMDRIHVVVKEISTVGDDPSSSIWPDTLFHDSPQGSSKQDFPNVAMLKSNTEIVISPKPRDKRPDPAQWTCPLQIVPGVLDSTGLSIVNTPNDPLPAFPSLPEVSPGCILVHPRSLALESSSKPSGKMWVHMKAGTSQTLPAEIRLVQVQFSVDMPEKTAGQ